MKRWVIFSFLCFSSLYSADYWFSGTAAERHRKMVETLTPQSPELPWWDRSYLTGNWNGGRSKLANDGVTIGTSYVSDILGNPIGGKARGFAFAGSFGLDINIDIGKHTALKGLYLYTSVVGRTGTNLSADKIGNQYPVAQVYGGQNVRLNELYLKQVLFNEWLLMKGGRLNAGNDFLQSELYYKFVNNGFDGNPISVFFNGPFTAYPNATWGFYLQFRPYKRILAKVAAYIAQDDVSENKYHGFNWSLNGSDGTQLITEWSYQVNQLKEDCGYPGNYRAGAFYYTESKGDKFLGGHYHGNWGYYFLIDQMIFRVGDPKLKRGLTPFVAVLFAPKDRNLLPFYISSGLVYKGLFPSRPNDYTNLGFIYGKYSTDMKKAQEIARRTHLMPVPTFGNQPQNFESVVELNHWFQINPWLIIVPDIQYVINPRGLGTIKDALVVGAQISITL
ncbi:MAG: carbohydrate porin [Chlamydiia bacterium]|nr:carbohydrate porin [Chlamydiia bacterium]